MGSLVSSLCEIFISIIFKCSAEWNIDSLAISIYKHTNMVYFDLNLLQPNLILISLSFSAASLATLAKLFLDPKCGGGRQTKCNGFLLSLGAYSS